MTGNRSSRRHRLARRAGVSFAAVAVATAAFAVPSSAQGEPNFSFAGLNPRSGAAIAASDNLSGQFSYCRNANGLGSELYFNAAGPSGLTVRHATVSPMVVPIHIGVVDVINTGGETPFSDTFVTLGVVDGTAVEFGTSGPSDAQYGGLSFSPSGIGLVSWDYAGTSTCGESVVMPILEPYLNGAGSSTTEAPPTTAAPTTTASPTTTEAPTTTAAPTTTEAPTTTAP